MTNEDWRYWPDAGLIVMGLAAIVALAIAVSGYFSSDSEISAARGFLLVCASSLAVVVVAASLPILEGGSHGLVALYVVLCVLDLLGTSIAAFLLERDDRGHGGRRPGADRSFDAAARHCDGSFKNAVTLRPALAAAGPQRSRHAKESET
jgi:hypothetical protein